MLIVPNPPWGSDPQDIFTFSIMDAVIISRNVRFTFISVIDQSGNKRH